MLKTIRWHLGFCNEKYLPTHRGFESHIGYMLGHEDYYLHTNAPSGICCQDKGDETQGNLKQLFSLISWRGQARIRLQAQRHARPRGKGKIHIWRLLRATQKQIQACKGKGLKRVKIHISHTPCVNCELNGPEGKVLLLHLCRPRIQPHPRSCRQLERTAPFPVPALPGHTFAAAGAKEIYRHVSQREESGQKKILRCSLFSNLTNL